MVFDQSERAQGPIYVIKKNKYILLDVLVCSIAVYYPTLLRRVHICTRLIPPGRVKFKTLASQNFWEKKSLDNKSLIRRFGV